MSIKRKHRSKKRKGDSEIVPLPANSISPLSNTPNDDDQLIEINISSWVKSPVELTINQSSSTEHIVQKSNSLEYGLQHDFSMDHEVYDRISPAYSSSEQLSTSEQVTEQMKRLELASEQMSASQSSLCSPTSSFEQICSMFSPNSTNPYSSAPIMPELNSLSRSSEITLRKKCDTLPSRPVSACTTLKKQICSKSASSFLSDSLMSRTVSDTQSIALVPHRSHLPLIRGSSINTSNESELSDFTSPYTSRPRSLADYFPNSTRSSLGKSIDSDTPEDPSENYILNPDPVIAACCSDPLLCVVKPLESSQIDGAVQCPLSRSFPSPVVGVVTGGHTAERPAREGKRNSSEGRWIREILNKTKPVGECRMQFNVHSLGASNSRKKTVFIAIITTAIFELILFLHVCFLSCSSLHLQKRFNDCIPLYVAFIWVNQLSISHFPVWSNQIFDLIIQESDCLRNKV